MRQQKSYILLIRCNKDVKIRTKSNKIFLIKRGIYAYVGSCGKYCNRRIERHLSKIKNKFHWHIDFLTSNSDCETIAVLILNREEKEVASALFLHMHDYIKDFGSSDDRENLSHLFLVDDLRKLLFI
ncbi:DUF123 domain-containing protein [Sulfolobus tengchongensis]|uniref:DUF123 domain-containing protein n=1 Tax=Sulfolobus tengchongensis TaxID=207809 RepID=A0AAX4KZJ6_9CREN